MPILSKKSKDLLNWFYKEHSPSEVIRLIELFKNLPNFKVATRAKVVNAELNYMQYLPTPTMEKSLPTLSDVHIAYKKAIRMQRHNKSL